VVGRRIPTNQIGLLADRYAALAAGRARPATGFVSQPEPRSIGLYARGKQLTAGNILLAGHLAEVPGVSIWDVVPDPAFVAEAQGFSWLDDLAAYGTPAAVRLAQDWTRDWISRHGRGTGPGWTPDLTGRRIIRWIHHAGLLLAASDRAVTDSFYRAITRQSDYLSRRWKAAAPGLARFEALTGLVYAGISLVGLERLVAPAVAALDAACQSDIDAEGGIPSRNPEELLEVLTLLTWSARAMSETTHPVPAALSDAIIRIAPALRTLRHADGELARFHGGDKGLEGRLDQALAAAGARPGVPLAVAGRTRRPHRPRLDRRLRADLGPPRADRQLRLGHVLRPRLAPRRPCHAVAFRADAGRCLVLAPWADGRETGPSRRRHRRAPGSGA
jgi:uncharacterized heparinase superfamily protein